MPISRPAVSQHLRVLKDAGLVADHAEGTKRIYAIDPSGLAKLRADELRYIDELWRRWSPAWQDLPASETAAIKQALAEPGALEAACAYYAAIPLSGGPYSLAARAIGPFTGFFVGWADWLQLVIMAAVVIDDGTR